MKKNSPLLSFFTAATFSLVSSSVLAYPITNFVNFTCPPINMVSNFGGYLAGYGTEFILGQTNQIYYVSPQYPTGVPVSITNYYSSATSYNSVTGFTTCSYISLNTNESPFELAYYVTNGKGGIVQSQYTDSIVIGFPIGLHS